MEKQLIKIISIQLGINAKNALEISTTKKAPKYQADVMIEILSTLEKVSDVIDLHLSETLKGMRLEYFNRVFLSGVLNKDCITPLTKDVIEFAKNMKANNYGTEWLRGDA